MLNDQINLLINEIKCLKEEIRKKEKLLSEYIAEENNQIACKYSQELTKEEIVRYSRQMLVSEMGLSGQINLKRGKALIVGAGGLGCPAAVYLASAGVGEITIVDYDKVELSNLHRQILHTEDDEDIAKVDSAYDKLHSINRNIKIIPLKLHIASASMKELMSKNKFDVVIDGSDNVATRYLLNDACVLNGAPLVSGSALQTEAQLTVYNYKNGPCYRCLFPTPPPSETVTNCGDSGVLGPVPGIIGVLQAMQAIKILTNSDGVLNGRLLLFDGSTSTFRNIKLRSRNVNCAVCGDEPSVKDLIDYEQFCGSKSHDKVINIDILDDVDHIDVRQLDEKLKSGNILVDVRPQSQFEMCHLPNSINLPYDDVRKLNGLSLVEEILSGILNEGKKEAYFLCRRGNDSQRTISYLKQHLPKFSLKLKNVKGGLYAYSKYVDAEFPIF